jgi:capsular polysaccharide transport system permease protein
MKRSPWQIQMAVIFALLMREIKTRFGGQWTGVIWLLGLPLLQLGLWVMVNTYLRGRLVRGGYEFAIFLIVAMIPYQLCTGMWTQMSSAISSNLGLFAFRQVKPLDTMIARAILEFVIDVFTFVLVMLLLARFGFKVVLPMHLLDYMTAWAAYVFFGFNVGVFLATVSGVVPRLGVVVSMLSLPLYVTSGLLFDISHSPPELLYWFQFNPLLHLNELGRAAWLPGYKAMPGISYGYPIFVGLVFGGLGSAIYSLRRQKLATGD